MKVFGGDLFALAIFILLWFEGVFSLYGLIEGGEPRMVLIDGLFDGLRG
jgi:hypothetical protein